MIDLLLKLFLITLVFVFSPILKMMRKLLILISLFISTETIAQKAKLIWADEFKKSGLPDPAKWDYDVGDHGWGNQELQYYSRADKENARVEKGVLIIEAKADRLHS